jgi:hypothetical protein
MRYRKTSADGKTSLISEPFEWSSKNQILMEEEEKNDFHSIKCCRQKLCMLHNKRNPPATVHAG